MNPTSLSSDFRRLGGLIFTLVALLWPQVTSANLPPQLLILNAANELTAREDTPILLRLVVTDAETPAGDLQLTVKPVNSRLLPAGNIVVEGQGNERVIRLTPAPDASGVSGVVVAVEDVSGGLAQGRVDLTWTPVDDLPVLAPIPHQITTEGAPPLWVPFSFTTPELPDLVRFTAASSRSNLATLPTITTTGTNRWLNLRVANGFVGSSVITIYPQAAKEVAASASVSFALTVLPREFALTNGTATPGDRAVVFDANRDGGLDVASGLQTGFTVLSQNRSSVQLPIAASGLALADVDGDGDVDAYLAEAAGRGVYWRNSSPLTSLQFSKADSFFGSLDSSANAAWADFDGDGDLDLVAGGGSSLLNRSSLTPVLFARNDGAGSFVTLTNRLPAASDALLVADFDGDGAPDVLLGSGLGQTNQAVVWRNEGGFRFTPTSWRVPAPLLMAAGAVDFDGDGRLDLWVLHRSSANVLGSPRVLALWRQTSVGFAEVLRLPGEAVAQAGPPAWGDFDGDGWLDLVAPRLSPAVWGTSLGARVTNCFALYRNDGRGGFTAGNYLFGNGAGYSPAAGDFNRDGSLDLWVPEGQGRLMFNQLRRPNLPPEPPSGLFALAEGTNVLFTWLPARDLNQTAPLTYNLRVGTWPGSNDVVASMSLDDGTRLQPAPGNAGFALSRRLLLGPVDTDVLYWSVQAVDNSFAGGMWAPEQTVRVQGIPNEPPVIRGMADVVMNEDTTAVLAVKVTDDFSSPSQVVTEVFTSNLKLFPTFKQGPARATVFSPSTNRPITLRPAENAFGEAEITMIATDGRGARTTNQVKVIVRPVNDAPVLTVAPVQQEIAGQPSSPLTLLVNDVDDSEIGLSYEVVEGTSLPLATGVFSGTGISRELVVTPGKDSGGQIVLKLLATDPAGASGVAMTTFVFGEVAFQPARIQEPLSHEIVAVEWADLDGDGTMELCVPAPDRRGLMIQKWTANGFVTARILGLEDTAKYVVLARDLDNDGSVDLVVQTKPASEPNGTNYRLKLYRNLGNLDFSLVEGVFTSVTPVTNVWLADLDFDGAVDVLLEQFPGDGSSEVTYWRKRDGPYRQSSLGAVATGTCCQSVLDLDRDGDLELVGRTAALPDVASAYGWRTAGFSLENIGLPNGIAVGQADFDGDQSPELLTWNVKDQLIVSRWNGAAYETAMRLHTAVNRSSLLVTDLNQDGFSDVLWSGQFQGNLWFGNAELGFTPVSTELTRYGMANAKAADFDGDGVMDVAGHVNYPTGMQNVVFRGRSRLTNAVPAAPTALGSEINGDEVLLTWNLATDSNQKTGLTYNLRLGTAPGRGDVWSAESRSDGRRLLPRIGNVSWATEVTLRTLKPGRTYYWSVQAVDASFAGGPFAPEQSFRLVGPPEFTGPTNTSLPTVAAEGDEPVRLAFTLMDPENPEVVPDVTWESSDRNLLPDDRIRWEGTGTNRTLVLRPVAGWAGAAVVELRATSATSGNTGTHRVTLRVAPGANYSFTIRRELAVRTGSAVGLDLAFGIPADTFSNLSVTRSPSHGRLTGVPPRLNYEPEPGFVGFDRVIYAGDHVGGLGLAGEVVLLVGEPKRVNTVVKRGPGKTLEFSVNGRPHVSVRFESSLDLKFWQTVQFMSLDAAGELNFGLSPEVPDGGTFYRLVEIP